MYNISHALNILYIYIIIYKYIISPVSLELNFWVVFVLSFGLYFEPNKQLYI